MSVSVLHNGNNGYTDSMGGSTPYGSTSATSTTDFSETDVDGSAAQSFFVRALFDFTGQDTSSLSFKRGDVIEVLNTLPSGWWDGLLDDERGWFPSNYVQPITEQEAEAALSLRLGLQQQQPQPPLDPQLDRQQQTQLEQQRLLQQQQQQQQRTQLVQRQLAQQRQHGQGQQRGPYEEEAQWLDDDDDQPPPDQAARAPGQPSDFWVPQVTPDGQIFYVNTITGEQSRFLPTEVDDAQRQEKRPPATGRQRSATDASSSSSKGANSAGFGFHLRSGTPEPWVKRLADDGMSYYYVNAQTGLVRWTPPSPTSGPRTLRREDPNGRGATIDPYNNSRARANSETGRQLAQNVRRASVYSDHSEVNPYDDMRPATGNNIRPQPRLGPAAETEEVLVHPLQIARILQHELSPPPLPAITSYSEAACDAINAVVESFAERSRLANLQVDPSEVVAQSAAMAHKVTLVVVAVRNLLYVSGTLTGPLPALANSHMGEDTDWVRSQIKPFQRKVTATLSKLVLSARAVNANPDWPTTTSTGRVESDAAELERAVTTFVFEIQRSAASQRAKRLKGVLLPGEDGAGVGPGLIGAGTAGQWKGSGFVSLSGDRAYPPQRKLGREVVSELSNLRLQAEDKIATLFSSITQYKNASLRTTSDYGVADVRAVSDRVILAGRVAIAQLSEFLALAEDIDVAGYVDVEGFDNVPEAYLQDVQKARELIRTFETTRQALYDDSSVVLMASQAIHVSLFGQGGQGPPEIVHSAIPALRENLGTLMETLELLLDIAQSQGEARQGLHHSSQLGHSGLENNWAEIREQLQGDSGDIIGLAQAIQEGGRPASREAWAAQQSQAYPPVPAASSAGEPPSMVDGEMPPSASAPAATGVDSIAPISGALDFASVADEEELSDDEFDRRGHPKMGGNRQRERERIDRQASKLARIVGERPPDQWLQNKVQELAPWYLRPEHTNASEIVLNPDGGVRAATLSALIERLTMHDGSDAKYNDTFMMTFKSFSSVDEVFDMLVARFNIQPPDGLTPEQLEEWKKVKKTPIRLRAINAIRKLIDSLEKDDLHILTRVKMFTNDIFTTSPEMTGAAKNIAHIVKRVEEGGLDGVRSLQPTVPEFPPPSILPRKSGKITKLLEIDALELARQLTILESELFFKIKQSDCIARSKESMPAGPDTIKSVINLANKMSDWVADAVLSREDPRRRAAVIKHFVAVAEKCRALHNFSTMAALIAGLNGPPIRRLKRTWEQVNTRITSQLDDLEKTLDTAHNFTAYKSLLSSIQPPCVPFLGVYLTVLTFIQDGSKDILKDGGLINFQKRQKTADVIQEITKFQGQPYNLTKIQTIRTFIEESLANLDNAPDFWQLSLEREPREREDEKMARLLQESGFL